MIASLLASGGTDEVWCADCPAPAIGSRGGRAYCAEHDPRRVQVLMPVAQAARLVAWLERAGASGAAYRRLRGYPADGPANDEVLALISSDGTDAEDLRAAIEAALATNAPVTGGPA